MHMPDLSASTYSQFAQCTKLMVLRDFMTLWQSVVNDVECDKARFQLSCERCYFAWSIHSDYRLRLLANWSACLGACAFGFSKRALKYAKRYLNIARAHEDQDLLMWLASYAMWQASKHTADATTCAQWQSESTRLGCRAGIYKAANK